MKSVRLNEGYCLSAHDAVLCTNLNTMYFPFIIFHPCTPGPEINLSSLLTLLWAHCPRRRYLAARWMTLWVRIWLRAWMSVPGKCCVLSGRGLCDGLIPRPEEPFRQDSVSLTVMVNFYIYNEYIRVEEIRL